MSGAPWLLTSHGRLDEEYTKQSLYDVTENKCYHAEPEPEPEPFLNEKRVIGSTSDGWLIFSHFWEDVFYLWNPKSGSRIQLPPVEYTAFLSVVALSKPPTEADCHVIFTAQRSFIISYCRIGDDEFKTLNRLIVAMKRSSRGRLIYGVEAQRNFVLVSIEFVDNELLVTPMFKLKGSLKHDKIEGVHLVESEEEGELLLVYKIQPSLHADDCFSFRVYRVNPAERRHNVELESIGDRTLFIGDWGDSFCCSAAANKTKPNCVYYAREWSRIIYVYSMDDGSITTLLPSPAIHPYKPFNSWIQQQPSHHLLTDYFHHHATN